LTYSVGGTSHAEGVGKCRINLPMIQGGSMRIGSSKGGGGTSEKKKLLAAKNENLNKAGMGLRGGGTISAEEKNIKVTKRKV